MNRKLIAIGVGAGDGRYLTISAKEKIENSDIIYYPVVSKGEKSMALESIKKYVREGTKLCELVFPMKKTGLERAWQMAAESINETLEKEGHSSFITIGDVMTFSTFSYLRDRIECDIDVEYEPGITSYQVASSAIGEHLGIGKSGFGILPGIESEKQCLDLFEYFDTLAILKPCEKSVGYLEKISKKMDIEVKSVTYGGYEKMEVRSELDYSYKLPYMSVLLVKRIRNNGGDFSE